MTREEKARDYAESQRKTIKQCFPDNTESTYALILYMIEWAYKFGWVDSAISSLEEELKKAKGNN